MPFEVKTIAYANHTVEEVWEVSPGWRERNGHPPGKISYNQLFRQDAMHSVVCFIKERRLESDPSAWVIYRILFPDTVPSQFYLETCLVDREEFLELFDVELTKLLAKKILQAGGREDSEHDETA